MHTATAKVHGAEVNLSEQYHEARELMGLRTSNHEALLGAVTTVYLNIPHTEERWIESYASLILEMQDRIAMIAQYNLGLVTTYH
jgi:hypothetical protein